MKSIIRTMSLMLALFCCFIPLAAFAEQTEPLTVESQAGRLTEGCDTTEEKRWRYTATLNMSQLLNTPGRRG